MSSSIDQLAEECLQQLLVELLRDKPQQASGLVVQHMTAHQQAGILLQVQRPNQHIYGILISA